MNKLPTPEEIQQMRLDTLKVFCPSAIPYITFGQMESEPDRERLFNWREGFQHVLNMLIHTDQALQSLTPGGSEYVHNPERCVALVKEQQAALHEARKKVSRLEKALRPFATSKTSSTGDRDEHHWQCLVTAQHLSDARDALGLR